MSGRTVFHTGTISGGTDYATYPNLAVLGIEIGTQPGEHLSDRVAEIEAIFAEIEPTEPTFHGRGRRPAGPRPVPGRGPRAAAVHGGRGDERRARSRAAVTGMNGWTDAALMQAAGIPTVLIGATGGNYHAPGEWVSVSEFIRLCAIVEQAAVSFLG